MPEMINAFLVKWVILCNYEYEFYILKKLMICSSFKWVFLSIMQMYAA